MLGLFAVAILASLSSTYAEVSECHNKVLDVYFLIDKSASISVPELEVEKKVVRGIINSFDIGAAKTRVGVVTFSNDTEHIVELGQHNSLSDFDDVDLVPRPYRKVGTLTHLGLEDILVHFADEGRSSVQQVIIVITDGKSTAPGPLKATCTKIHTQYDMTVIAIGVGRDADFAELDLIASGTDGDNVYHAKSYEHLNEIKENITSGVCEAVDKDKDRVSCNAICLVNGLVEGLSKAGETVKFTCFEGYGLSGEEYATCGSDGKWDVEPPKCLKSCHFKTGIQFGSVEYLNAKLNRVGGKVRYTCDQGYTLRGESTLECMSFGQWNDTVPRCKYERCPVVPRINNGQITSQEYHIGGTAKFSCDFGFKIKGSDTLTCQDNLKWDSKAPKCARQKLCSLPKYFRYGAVSKSGLFVEGETVSYTCQDGYRLEGQATLTCGEKGKWDADTPECINTRCSWLPFVKNGNVKRTGSDPVTQLEITCETGYKLKGESVLTCRDNGTWSSDFPNCVVEDKCKPIRYLRNGEVKSYSNLPGSQIEVTCHYGYYLSESTGKINCSSAGEWSSTVPYCIRDESVTIPVRKCPHIVDLPNGRCVGSHDRFGSVTCSCNSGYIISGKEKIRCQTGARWSIPMYGSNYPRCTYKRCKQLRGLSDGEAVYTEDNEGAVIKYSCKPGFYLRGARLIKCRNGEWSASPPTCREERCPNLISLPNAVVGNITSGDYTGSSRIIECNKGYKIVGPASILCFKGDWAPSIPKCRSVKMCKSMDFFKYGVVEGDDYNIGSRVQVSCEPGYVLKGASSVKCLPDKKWSETPKCELKVCPEIRYFKDGKTINYDNKIGTTVEFVCNEHFERKGNQFIVCQPDGTWSADVPTCEAKPLCPSICISHGEVLYDGQEPGDLAIFRCDDGYIISGPPKAECQANGTWTVDPPVCIRKIPDECLVKKMDVYFVVEVSNSEIIEKLESAMKAIAYHFRLNGPNIRVGVISFDDDVRIETKLKTYQNNTAFASGRLLSRKVQRGKGHNLYKAMQLLTSDYIFPLKKEKAAIFITENRVQRMDLINITLPRLDALDVSRFCIGIGSRPEYENLKTIASGENETNTWMFDKFEDIEQGTTAYETAQGICEHEPNPEEEGVLPTNPTEECVDVQLDVYLIVDTSKSIQSRQLSLAEITVKYVMNHFDMGPNKTRVGLITYNRYVYHDFNLTALPDHTAVNQIPTLLNRPPHKKLKGGTRTDLAVAKAMDSFGKESPAGRQRVFIIITDGRATAPLKDVINALDQTDIRRVAIGVGRGIDRDELQWLATGDKGEYMILVLSYEDLAKIDGVIATTACSDML